MKSRFTFGLLAAIVPLFIAAPASAALHPGDKIVVTVYNHPELSASPVVDGYGNISLPVVGSVHAQNLEPDELAARVRDRLAPYVRQVAVHVELDAQSDSIFVAGGPSGVLKYRPGETLTSIADELQLPSLSSQTTAPSNPHDTDAHAALNTSLDLQSGPVDFRRVGILRDGKALGPYDVIALRGEGQAGPALVPGDTIQLVNKPVAVSISGDVPQPGTVYLDKNEPLSQALNQVGGVAATSTQSDITLRRDGIAQTLTLGSPEFAEPAQNGDAIYIPRAPHVDVLGTVEHPGDTVLRGNATLVSAIYYAGGPAKYANLKSVQVLHGGKRTTYDLAKIQGGSSGENPTLIDGDVVFVPQGSTWDWSNVWQALGALGLFGLHL